MEEPVNGEKIEWLYQAEAADTLLRDPPRVPDERLLRLLGQHFWSLGRVVEALASIHLLEQRKDLEPAELNLRGYWQLYLGQSSESKASFEAAMRQDQKNTASLLGYAYALFYLEDFEAAAGVFQKLMVEAASWKSPPIMAAASLALARGQKPAEIQVAPLPGLPSGLADILQMKLLYGVAKAIESAQAYLPSLATGEQLPLKRCLVELYLEAGQEQTALSIAEELLKSNPEDGLLLLFKGIALRRMQRKKASHQAFTKATQKAPFDPRAWGGYAAGWLELQDYHNAVKAFRIALFLDNTNPLFWGDLGIAEYLLEDYAQAKNSLSKAIELGIRSFTNYFNRGMACLNLNEIHNAIEDWQLAVVVEPGHPRAGEVADLIRQASGEESDDRFIFGEIE